MKTIAVKFGGSSLADARQFEKVKRIIEDDPARRLVVVSAPGKRFDGDTKVTDLLIDCWKKAYAHESFIEVLEKVKRRFTDIEAELKLDTGLDREFGLIEANLNSMPHYDYIVSRGEYLCARLMAVYLGAEFVDPARYVCFDNEGVLNEELTYKRLSTALAEHEKAVIAGFYGARPDGAVQTFSRGGSDVTGALVAAAAHAELYENWTDVSGLLMADPRVIDSPRPVDFISYRELRILSYMGASVLHTDAVKPVRPFSIPINIKNTNKPDDEGTYIMAQLPAGRAARAVTGIAGRKGLTVVQVEKSMVSDGAGFTAVLLDIFKAHKVPFEQCLTGIDTISMVIRSDLFQSAKDAVLNDIKKALEPDMLAVKENLSMITVVGENVSGSQNMTVRLLAAVADAGIEISTINQGAGNLNLIIGVEDKNYSAAIRALYGVINKL